MIGTYSFLHPSLQAPSEQASTDTAVGHLNRMQQRSQTSTLGLLLRVLRSNMSLDCCISGSQTTSGSAWLTIG